jgi:predicted nucleic acid-binding protein
LTIYADSSFLVSSYVDDAHSREADRRMSAAPAVWLTPFNRIEFAHALYQQVFRGRFSAAEARQAWNNFQRDCRSGVWIPASLPERLWETSILLAEMHGPALGVRTLDSLHVACALELKAERFWTFDERQARLAEVVGLDTSA